MAALKKKSRSTSKKAAQDGEIKIDVGESFEVGSTKDNDFDLDMDSATFQGKKGQAGSRLRDSF